MGCRQGKQDAQTEAEKLKEFTSLSEPKAPPKTDSRLPLDAREVFKLKQSWKAIKRKISFTGIEMFIR